MQQPKTRDKADAGERRRARDHKKIRGERGGSGRRKKNVGEGATNERERRRRSRSRRRGRSRSYNIYIVRDYMTPVAGLTCNLHIKEDEREHQLQARFTIRCMMHTRDIRCLTWECRCFEIFYEFGTLGKLTLTYAPKR